MAYDGPRLLGWPFHIRPLLGARRLRTAVAHALALFVVVAQPVPFLAWLRGGASPLAPVLASLRLRPAVGHALALVVVVAQPAAFLAWLGGAHATPEQA